MRDLNAEAKAPVVKRVIRMDVQSGNDSCGCQISADGVVVFHWGGGSSDPNDRHRNWMALSLALFEEGKRRGGGEP